MSTLQHSMGPNVGASQLINFNSSDTHTDTKIKIHSVEVETNTSPILPEYHGVVVDHEDVRVEPRSNDDGGISVTWEDLWVTVSDIKGRRRPIVQGLTGYAQPGEVLAIMGPSGFGKTTLLDALAGRLGANTRHTGDILMNGRKQALAYGTLAYVTQDETLIAMLTVIEAVYYSAQSEKKDRAEITIREMGLHDCMNTRIGGWGTKGLSRGERRRVSICIEILTRPKLLFLDEPTSGLDSAASYYVMSRITQLEQRKGRTIIVAIHHRAVKCPNCSTTFVSCLWVEWCTLALLAQQMRMINTDFDEDIEHGSTGKVAKEEVINILVTSYNSSDSHRRVKRQASDICRKVTQEISKTWNLSFLKSEGHNIPATVPECFREVDHLRRAEAKLASFFTQCLVLTKRSSVNMSRDVGYYWLRLAIYIALAVGLGTLFYGVGTSYSSIRPRGALLMFITSFLTFMAIGGFPSFVEDMKVFEVERLNGHYGTTAFVIGNTLSSVPYLLLISLIPGALAYYLTGLQRGFEHFVYFNLVLFTSMMLVESLMMTVASIVPNFLMGIIAGGGIQGLMMLGSGFFQLPNDLPKMLWKYPVYYVAFQKYAYQGLCKNEYEGLYFSSDQTGGFDVIISGEEILRDEFQVEMGYSKWVDLGILLGMVVVYRVLFLVIIKIVEKVKPVTCH
ncbi:hypothetical protein RHSIM_RhsimUnG0188300 [Rhododendron simsii]|uniref:ABC transporter domain-containing protein n=1 Tax=Rhododendron simsii TaxID=118357 RepID=A0A834FTP9_RHOSS|nr:hypothetical protein RHSIM_RhsimUnG0188300 [Rhododendron simsii]